MFAFAKNKSIFKKPIKNHKITISLYVKIIMSKKEKENKKMKTILTGFVFATKI